MGEVREFTRTGKKRPPKVAKVPPADPIQETLDALKEAVRLGGVQMLAIVTVTADGPSHLLWGDGATLGDAAQLLLALRVASDEVVEGVMSDECCECGGPTKEPV